MNPSIQAAFERQARLQSESFGIVPWSLTGDDRADYLRSMCWALIDELSEAMAEVSWKPWASDHFINPDAFIGELVDAFHFLMNMALVVDPTGEKFATAYFAKANVNMRRQAAGYTHTYMKGEDGRALDEPYKS